jgi:hypothetical protein
LYRWIDLATPLKQKKKTVSQGRQTHIDDHRQNGIKKIPRDDPGDFGKLYLKL